MTITTYALTIETFAPVLTTLSALLDKGAAHARAKGVKLEALIGARLAPDMYPLSTQVKLACHHAKDATARLTGATPPKIDNEELTFDELKILIEKNALLSEKHERKRIRWRRGSQDRADAAG